MGIEEAFLNILKTIYDKLVVNIIFSGERLKYFPLRSATRQGCALSPFLFNILLEVLSVQSGKKQFKDIIIRKKKRTYIFEYR